MMSRITLHLRKQARARDIETEFIGFASTDTIQHGVRSRLRFNNRSAGRGITTDPQLTVTVEESAVVHDDDGNLLGDSQDDDGERRKMAEWYEMQMRPKTPPVARISGKMVRDDESYLDMP
ncbi:hypothetical protein PHLCEN_2v6723 [Hermanssonia centrifuga]|nr:hypothetical protein PHLCEN_2v6723 [Hermanssonia centrifuga]